MWPDEESIRLYRDALQSREIWADDFTDEQIKRMIVDAIVVQQNWLARAATVWGSGILYRTDWSSSTLAIEASPRPTHTPRSSEDTP